MLGVNETKYDAAKHTIISNASCTTNCLVPMVKVMRDAFGFVRGVDGRRSTATPTTRTFSICRTRICAARAPRRCRMIPTTTGAAKATALVIPELKGKIDGISVRVPTPDVSLTDLVVEVEKRDDASRR